MSEPAGLQRRLGLPVLLLYGLGTILGAGIYVLVGEIAGTAGAWAPVSFLVAGGLALFCGLSFGELSARFPVSAGEAAYVEAGFDAPRLATVVGLLVALTGVVSASAIVRGFTGYLAAFVVVPDPLAISGLVLLLGLVAALGVDLSVGAAAVMTLLEVVGLLLVVGVAWPALAEVPGRMADSGGDVGAVAVFVGAFLSFYAFIGFEDMVNSAEEARDPERTMPWAILGALGVATVLYVVVAAVCVGALSPEELAASDAPLTEVYARHGGSRELLGGIGLFAVANGALVQIIMGSRVLYGLARRGWLPAPLARVSPRTHTPVVATVLVTGVVLLLALSFPLSALAQVTSFVLLGVFGLVSAALWRIKGQGRPEPAFTVPRAVPLVGAVLVGAFLIFRVGVLLGLVG